MANNMSVTLKAKDANASNSTGKTKFKISDLDFYYGDFHALKNLNMDIEENIVTAFIGPSGCGKSTFLKTLNRMQDLVSYAKVDGLISLDGQDIYQKNYGTSATFFAVMSLFF